MGGVIFVIPMTLTIALVDKETFRKERDSIILGCLGLSSFTYLIATSNEAVVAFQEYFTCHSFGIVPGLDCGDSPNVRLQVFGALVLVSVILIGLIPLINLIFTVKWTCKCMFCKLENLCTS